jgi:hypothetical protein
MGTEAEDYYGLEWFGIWNEGPGPRSRFYLERGHFGSGTDLERSLSVDLEL